MSPGKSIFDFFINYEKTALHIFFFNLVRMFSGNYVWSYGSVSRKTHFSSSFLGPLIVHGLSFSCPFNFPNGNLKQQLSHIGVFICYQNIDTKNKLNLHIYGIHFLNPYKTVVSHLNVNCDISN